MLKTNFTNGTPYAELCIPAATWMYSCPSPNQISPGTSNPDPLHDQQRDVSKHVVNDTRGEVACEKLSQKES